MSSSSSVQLPDLLGLSRNFELRTNRHCRTVTSASEDWFMTQQNILSDAEKAALTSLKIGLLASVCFPTCDSPQLRIAADFLTALVVCNCRLTRARTLRECGWTDTALLNNSLFREVMPKMPSESSKDRFSRSIEGFRTAQEKVLSYRQNNTLPTVEAYLELRRDLGGTALMFDLIELTEGLKTMSEDQQWGTLKRSAADIIALSTDIVAYNTDQFMDNQFNIVSILRAHKGHTVQGAINYAFSLIEQALRDFRAAESALVQSPPLPQSPTSPWPLNLLARDAPPEPTPLSSDSQLYLRGLKDCIVGTLNWSYETELYLGAKGDEVRQFGWVFLRPRDNQE
ncbi:isoprenoid synthase domain-containing protein [Mycena polygramma]|nr:isoprenoid synthase domain-containing protein [Mycena polygramma]